MASLTLSPYTPKGELKDEARLVLAAIAFGLTIEETASRRGWSPSKVSRWRELLEETFGLNILAVLIALINENQFNPMRVAGLFDDADVDLLDKVHRALIDHPLSSRDQQFLGEAFRGYPTQTYWTASTFPEEFVAILRKAGLHDSNVHEVPLLERTTGLYAVIMAAAAMSGQIFWKNLPKIWTTKLEIEAPGDVTIVVTGPPGMKVNQHISVILPASPRTPGPAD